MCALPRGASGASAPGRSSPANSLLVSLDARRFRRASVSVIRAAWARPTPESPPRPSLRSTPPRSAPGARTSSDRRATKRAAFDAPMMPLAARRALPSGGSNGSAARVRPSAVAAPASSIEGAGDGASAATTDGELPPRVRWTDRRIAPWIASVFGIYFANGVVQITMGFLVQDRGGLEPAPAVSITALMLLANAAGAMLMQLIVVPRMGWGPRALLRAGMTLALIALTCLTLAPTLWAVAASTFAMGVASGMASPGYSAGASLAVSAREQGGIAGIINATGAITWIVAPVSATALYGWVPLSPFLVALCLVGLSCSCSWWLLRRLDIASRARD